MSDHVRDQPCDIASILRRTGFSTETLQAEGSTGVVVHGELDLATAPALARVLSSALDRRPAELHLDLGPLTFVDSTGIRVLLDAWHRAEAVGCSFVLRSPRRSVARTLRLVGAGHLVAAASADGVS